MSLAPRISQIVSLPERQVAAVLGLLADGATIPFIARYRKERTGDLDEVVLRSIVDERRRLVELDQRRETIRTAIEAQGKLTPKLARDLAACTSKTTLEDLYAPYRQRRKTRADSARERGLQPLAERILAQPRQGSPEAEARRYLRPDRGVADAAAALQGARDIVAEQLAVDPQRRRTIRRLLWRVGQVRSTARKDADTSQFRDYVDFEESVERIPSHRYLALCRGEAQGVLSVKVRSPPGRALEQLMRSCRHHPRSPYGPQLAQAAEDALKRLLLPAAERAVRARLKRESDADAIDVFQQNLEALLLAAPLGARSVLGIDPGIRTGCKCAMVSATGALLAHQTLYLVGRRTPDRAGLEALLKQHRPDAIAVGNGTGGREALAVARDAARAVPGQVVVVSVNEAGASVYSASELAGQELPDVDLTVRGAVSIARRLQDPLAELVKIEPRSIGVGQYQHDVDQTSLERRLSEVVEHCVNHVGVDANTASPALLAHVAGIGPKLAERMVDHRAQRGAFRSRRALLEVSGLGPRTFEQCAGFLRIPGAANPLDDSAVHPERYALVERMARDLSTSVAGLVGPERRGRIDPSRYLDSDTGLSTLQDILTELDKPGRDPRSEFQAASFREDIQEITDLEVGMVLEGVVTNVTAFGAFVDIGVHRDGLVHISQLADHYIRSPHEVVRAGQTIRVKVLEVDVARKRITLSASQAA